MIKVENTDRVIMVNETKFVISNKQFMQSVANAVKSRCTCGTCTLCVCLKMKRDELREENRG